MPEGLYLHVPILMRRRIIFACIDPGSRGTCQRSVPGSGHANRHHPLTCTWRLHSPHTGASQFYYVQVSILFTYILLKTYTLP